MMCGYILLRWCCLKYEYMDLTAYAIFSRENSDNSIVLLSLLSEFETIIKFDFCFLNFHYLLFSFTIGMNAERWIFNLIYYFCLLNRLYICVICNLSILQYVEHSLKLNPFLGRKIGTCHLIPGDLIPVSW